MLVEIIRIRNNFDRILNDDASQSKRHFYKFDICRNLIIKYFRWIQFSLTDYWKTICIIIYVPKLKYWQQIFIENDCDYKMPLGHSVQINNECWILHFKRPIYPTHISSTTTQIINLLYNEVGNPWLIKLSFGSYEKQDK